MAFLNSKILVPLTSGFDREKFTKSECNYLQISFKFELFRYAYLPAIGIFIFHYKTQLNSMQIKLSFNLPDFCGKFCLF